MNKKYEYDSEFPLSVWIGNLGKYNEGYLIGEWLKLPATDKEINKLLERIGTSDKPDVNGVYYEEYFCADYDNYTGLKDVLNYEYDLSYLNYFAYKLEQLSPKEYEKLRLIVKNQNLEFYETLNFLAQDFINKIEDYKDFDKKDIGTINYDISFFENDIDYKNFLYSKEIQDRDYDGDGVKDIHDADFRDREVETFGDLDKKEKDKIKEMNKGRTR